MNNLFDFTREMIATNITVYAKWKATFTFIFNSKGGTEVAEQTVISGDKAQKPTDPTRDDYLFEGWYREETFINLFDFTKETITADTTIYAKWGKIGKLTFSTSPVVSSLQLEMSSNMEITNIGVVIRLATEVAPTKEEAQASAGYITLRIDADSTRKFSISQHYTSNFGDGLTLDDVLVPNTNYKLYLFFESNAIPSGTLIEGATLTNDVIALSFMTATLPSAGDAVWDDAWTNKKFVGSLSEWSYSENQKGIFIVYTKVNLDHTSIVLNSRTANDKFFQRIGIFSFNTANSNAPDFFLNISKLGGSYPDADQYYYVIGSDDKEKISGKALRLEITNGSVAFKFKVPLVRYSHP